MVLMDLLVRGRSKEVQEEGREWKTRAG